jgi:hypothetical protein
MTTTVFADVIPLCAAHLESVRREVRFEMVAAGEYEREHHVCEPSEEQISHAIMMRGFARRRARDQARESLGRVYFMRSGDHIKIGTSVNVDARLQEIRKAGSAAFPEGVNVKETILLASIPGSYEQERELHRHFAHLRTVGEWFTAAPELIEYIESLEVEAA